MYFKGIYNILKMSYKIKVSIKVRPLIEGEETEGLSFQWRVENNTNFQTDNKGRQKGDSFSFSYVFYIGFHNAQVIIAIARPIVILQLWVLMEPHLHMASRMGVLTDQGLHHSL